ncbi:TPA: hypothetical protein QDB01_000396 [Burkholderia vietnamiensis]|nr:hypothetical protein [Burkholderia vietnamiensis]
MFHPTHIFPYIDSPLGWMVWLIVLLNALALGVVVHRVVRDTSQDGFAVAVFQEARIALNLALCSFLLLHSSLLHFPSGSVLAVLFSWYSVARALLFVDLSMTIDLIFDL